MWVALLVIAALAGAAWRTMEPGKYRSLCWILLGFFAFRVILGKLKAESDAKRRSQ